MASMNAVKQPREIDPIEEINGILKRAWYTLSSAYDISTCMPDLQVLFAGVKLNEPCLAAENLVASMLLEIMECVGRFSPWYKKPARAFGVIRMLDPGAKQSRWLLAPEAAQKWDAVINQLAEAIHRYHGLIQVMILVDSLMDDLPGDPCVSASCQCEPPRTIHLRKSILKHADITCDSCLQPYDISEKKTT